MNLDLTDPDLHSQMSPSLTTIRSARRSQLTRPSPQAYEVLLENYRNKFPITSPSKGLGDTTARSLAKKEGDAVHEQYFRIKEDVNRLVLV